MPRVNDKFVLQMFQPHKRFTRHKFTFCSFVPNEIVLSCSRIHLVVVSTLYYDPAGAELV